MDRNLNHTDIRNSGSFQFKKWTLFTFCAINIVVIIVMASMASKLMGSYVEEAYPHETNEYKQSLKNGAVIMVWVISVLSILFSLVGLMGAYKEHYCMTVTYAVLITLGALSSITSATKNSYYWFSAVLGFLICILTYAYAYDLRRIRILAFSRPMIITTGIPAPTFVQMVPGQPFQTAGVSQPPQYGAPHQYAASPQYGQQYPAPVQAGWNPPSYSSEEHKNNY